ncbi:MAG: hypothetical protein JWM11_4720 [Planctomycetaceae bacterium]|nr:hypothetical protein [Planctomycetaceae bacterium]
MASQLLPLNEQEVSRSSDAHQCPKFSVKLLARHGNSLLVTLIQIVAALPLWSKWVPAIALSVLFLAAGPALPWFIGKYAWTGKDFQEVLGPSLLGAAVFVAAFQCLQLWSVCRIWMLSIPATFLCRELHFAGTGTGVYVAIIAIVWFGSVNSTRLRPVWNCRNVCGCWFGAACVYALAVSVDSGVWKFLPNAVWWSVNLEETLESIGHSLILAGTLCAAVIVDRQDRGKRIKSHEIKTHG